MEKNRKGEKNIIIGVLALHGALREHIKALQKTGIRAIEIKFPGKINEIDGSIVLGGESIAVYKLIDKYDFKKYLDELYLSGKPMYGTCDGAILFGRTKKLEAIFIRVSGIISTGPEVDILSKINDNVILTRQKNILVGSFHPELQNELKIHNYF